MKKETAIEWLIKQLYNHEHHIDILDVATINGYFDAAKQMEKDQIIKAYEAGLTPQVFTEESAKAQQYYNETHGE